MNNLLKQRLVGALILLALGVVFWPIVFVEPGARSEAERLMIPARPEVPNGTIEPPDMAGLRASNDVAAQQRERETLAQPEESIPGLDGTANGAPDQSATTPASTGARKPRERAPEKLTIDSDGVPTAWVLRVASVSSAVTAEKLRSRLVDSGQKAYVKEIYSGGRTLYRVAIGPKFERAALTAIQADINRQYGVKSLVARWVP